MNSEQIAWLQEFFFEAARATFAGSLVEKTTIAGLPKSEVYRYQAGDLLYVDSYYANGEYSGGQTTIFDNDTPIWLMQYHGWCMDDNPNVVDFLKLALSATYEIEQWEGGRGPRIYRSDRWPGLGYVNAVDGKHDRFSNFEGYEAIYNRPELGDSVIFWHRYQGLLLANVE